MTNYYNYSWPVSSYTVRESLTITEVATPITYTVIWKSYAGATLKTDTLTYGQTSTAPTGTADDANWDYSWPKSSHTVPYSTTITETRTALSNYWASSTVSQYNAASTKLTFQGEEPILNPNYDGCATELTLLALLPDADSYSVGTVARVNVYAYPGELCSTWKYYKVS